MGNEAIDSHSKEAGTKIPVSTERSNSSDTVQNQTDNDEAFNNLEPSPLLFVLVSLMLAVLLMTLDQSIITTAIPHITDQFHSIIFTSMLGSNLIGLWFVAVYVLCNIKWVFLSAIVIFEVGSAVCGAAPSSTVLIVGRAIAGIGSAGIFSSALLIISNAVRLKKHPAYMALVGSMYGIASVAGPLIGGALTDRVSWRWCFYINLPIGTFTLCFMTLFYSAPRNENTRSHATISGQLVFLDIPGTLTFVPGIVCVLLSLQWCVTTYEWSNWRIILLFILFGLLMISFVLIQVLSKGNATIPPRIIGQRSVLAASWSIFCLGASFFTFIYYVPIWLQAIRGDSAVESGIHSIPMVLSSVVTILASGVLVTTTDYVPPFTLLSSVFMSVGAGLISTWQTNTPTRHWIGYQVLSGLGVGMGIQQGVVSLQSALSIAELPVGTAIVMFSQLFGGALFVSVAQSVFTSRLLSAIAVAFPEIDPKAVLGAGATQIANNVQPQALGSFLVVYKEAVVQAFYVGVGMASLSILGSAGMKWEPATKH